MIDKEAIKLYSEKKSKNFGYTFSVIFAAIFFYFYFKNAHVILELLFISLIIFFITIIYPQLLKFFSYYWEKFGIVLGRFFSPIILASVYIVTILPINLIFRILSIDLINKKKDKFLKSYWIKKETSEFTFKDQY